MKALWISSNTKVFGVIGDPIEHSLSPAMHNAAFRSFGMNCVYLAFRVKRGELEEAVKGMRCLGIAGFNVTMPHKVDIVKYLEGLDPIAEEIGSVNTVMNVGGRLIGFNTDGEGALNAITRAIGGPRGLGKAVILGAGGAARAVAYSLSKSAREVVVLNRTHGKALELAREMRGKTGGNIRGGPLSSAAEELFDAEVLINATPIGSWPRVEEAPVDGRALRDGMVVMDMVYNPLETRLLREAKEAGAIPIDGVTMLAHQGALSFKIWTGREPPIELMREAALGSMGGT